MPQVLSLSFLRIFLPVWCVTYLIASTAHTQSVLYELHKLDVNITLGDNIQTTLYDIYGLLPAYGSGIALALLLGFGFTGLVTAGFTRRRFLLPVAGMIALLTLLLSLQPIMGITLIAGARSGTGLFAQCMAGFCGGCLFWYLCARQVPTKG
ncbi:hypothetical protein [Alteromonas sp. 14N.309.X.WAT.G.H12]|uniref:hypothetical protein n=1 Tax=Alteromonas sp. 14N.309.X.WAT.G.H12 TaxID=3120824 RepID=UPI002FD539BA